MSGADKDYIPMFSWTNFFLAVLRLNNKVIFNPTKHKTWVSSWHENEAIGLDSFASATWSSVKLRCYTPPPPVKKVTLRPWPQLVTNLFSVAFQQLKSIVVMSGPFLTYKLGGQMPPQSPLVPPHEITFCPPRKSPFFLNLYKQTSED